MDTFKDQWEAKVAAFIFFFFSLLWFYMQFFLPKESPVYQFFGESYAVMALWGSLWGAFIARHWGGFRSLLGRALLLFTGGLFFQFFGQVAYSYYVYVLKIDVPYPSIGDIGYFGSILFYIGGILLLSQAAGVKIGLKSYRNKLQAVVIPLIVLGLGYFLFIRQHQFDWTKPLTVFLDLGYPMGEAIYISIAILAYLLSRKILGGVMRGKILFILFALCIQFVADYTFLYQVKNNTWYVGGIDDYLYVCAYFLMTVGLLNFKTLYKKLKQS